MVAFVEEPAFRLANNMAETEVLHRLVTALRYSEGEHAGLAEDERHKRVMNMIQFHQDITRKGTVLFQNLKTFSCQSGQYLKSGVLNRNDCTSRAVMALCKLTEEKALDDLDTFSRIPLPVMFGLMSRAYLGDSVDAQRHRRRW